MAVRLGAYFGVPARWWLLMQAEYDAAQLEGRLTEGVTPMPYNPDVLLTPTGVLLLDTPEQNAPPDTERHVRTVRYDNGAVALVGDEP